jgi:oxygen-independent coproporphyrinogen-3 oxidase
MLNVIQGGDEPTRRGFVTNYPDFRHWRKEEAEQSRRPLNVYVHVPYCIQSCAYCHYKTTTLASLQRGDIDRYVTSLRREIELASEQFHLRERPTISLYFGGGTPTLLSAENIEALLGTIRKHLTFQDPEITFEVEPLALTRHKADVLTQNGINRISIGIQSFWDDIVFRTGRKDTEKQSMIAINTALSTGAVVNIDLIAGLQGETEETWEYSVRRATESGAHSVTVYKLELYANTQYFASVRRGKISLPPDDAELEMARHALEEFPRCGYEPANFFTFTRGGKYVQRHTTTKWQGVDLSAFGASAFGSLGAWAYQNTNDLQRYTELLDERKLPLFRGYAYNTLELMTRDVLLGMKLIRFDRGAFKSRYGLDVAMLCGPTLTRLQDTGFVSVDDQSIALTKKGILYGDYVGRVLAASLETLANQPSAENCYVGNGLNQD